jgi:cell division protein YceG involved in septum cleavage
MNTFIDLRLKKYYFFSNRFLSFLEKRRTLILTGIIILSIMILSLGFITTKVTAEKSIQRDKTVVSVKIEKGDSLWSIASKYISDEYDNINTYIKEIKKSNGLVTDTIHEGRYIIVPYYTTIED